MSEANNTDTGVYKVSREQVYGMIDEELAYAEKLTKGLPRSFADDILLLQAATFDLSNYYLDGQQENALHLLRIIAAMAVRAMESHGAIPPDYPAIADPKQEHKNGN
jgi:hypothetical protein